MGSMKDFFSNWFGYTRRERRSTFILLNLILIILGLRYVIPAQNISLKEIPVDLREICLDTFPDSGKIKIQVRQRKPKTSWRKQSPVDLNSCDSASLVALPGIGPVLAARIIKYRNILGGFIAVSQLKEVYGLPEETCNIISPLVSADSLSIRKIRINTAEYKDLIRHPYFQRNEVASILKYRELRGEINDIKVMIENNLISEETASRIRKYLDFTK
jgi:DNA uptake protein ComE-like DNA-binding protein